MLTMMVAILVCNYQPRTSGDQLQAGQAGPTRKPQFDSTVETCQSRDQPPWCLLQELPNMFCEQE